MPDEAANIDNQAAQGQTTGTDSGGAGPVATKGTPDADSVIDSALDKFVTDDPESPEGSEKGQIEAKAGAKPKSDNAPDTPDTPDNDTKPDKPSDGEWTRARKALARAGVPHELVESMIETPDGATRLKAWGLSEAEKQSKADNEFRVRREAEKAAQTKQTNEPKADATANGTQPPRDSAAGSKDSAQTEQPFDLEKTLEPLTRELTAEGVASLKDALKAIVGKGDTASKTDVDKFTTGARAAFQQLASDIVEIQSDLARSALKDTYPMVSDDAKWKKVRDFIPTLRDIENARREAALARGEDYRGPQSAREFIKRAIEIELADDVQALRNQSTAERQLAMTKKGAAQLRASPTIQTRQAARPAAGKTAEDLALDAIVDHGASREDVLQLLDAR